MNTFLQVACLALGVSRLLSGYPVESQVWLAASVVIGVVRREAK